ncbi:hypothetical protein QJS66_18855 [Kocuria rhizophila]|nr:hypothetical protein QJS66_18855 [Kocuria rhizophila]
MAELTLTFLGAGSMNGSVLHSVLAAGARRAGCARSDPFGGVGGGPIAGRPRGGLRRESDPEADRKAVAGTSVCCWA